MADIGLVGLGVMGANLALNMAEKGYTVAVYNRTAARTDKFVAEARDLADRLVPCKTFAELAAAVQSPRPIVMMVKAGAPVDQTADALAKELSPGDMLIDAGNANFRNTRRRVAAFMDRGLDFIGIGVSGGEEGARHGPSIMAGGTPASWHRIGKILTDIAAKFDGEPCAALLGPEGAGHFVKTVHNGIEYADMQMIAEIYGIMRDGLGMDAASMGAVFERWNEGRLKSYLIEITGKVLATADEATGKPLVEVILDTAGQKGTGRWAIIEAQDLGVSATVIEAAVAGRNISADREMRLRGAEMFGDPAARLGGALGEGDALLQTLEAALLAGKIVAYDQGFALMAKASAEWDWNLPLGTVAKIWRAGCIIRSVFLDDITKAYAGSDDVGHLMFASPFSEMMQAGEISLRKVVAAAVSHGLPVPALSAALAYFDLSRSPRTTANLIQGQRDFFGAHGFQRVDKDGDDFHGPWSSE